MAAPRVRACLLVALAACFDPRFGDATRCGGPGADECPAGRRCVEGSCRVAVAAPDAPLSTPDAPLSTPDAPRPAPDAAPAPDGRVQGPADARLADARPPDAAVPLDAPTMVTIVVIRDPAGIGGGSFSVEVAGDVHDCDDACGLISIPVPVGSLISLSATPASGSYFTGFGAPCAGPARSCTVLANQSYTLRPRFQPIDHNLMFVTSAAFVGNFGSLTQANGKCQSEAASNGLLGTYIAMVSGGGVNLRNRMTVSGGATPARGFVRMDGLPVADTVDQMLVQHRVWYPVLYTAAGTPSIQAAWYGTGDDGNDSGAGDTCNGWSTIQGVGVTTSSGGNFQPLFGDDCSSPRPFLCAMVDRASVIDAPVPATGKLIWMSTGLLSPGPTVTPGTIDAICAGEKPGGVVSASALVAGTGPASALLSASTLYVRPDGIPVGTGAELAMGALRTGIWVNGDAQPNIDGHLIWTGAPAVTAAGSGTDCGDWKRFDSAGVAGMPVVGGSWWSAQSSQACAVGASVYCVED